MKLVADVDTITSNLKPLTTSIEDFTSAVSAFDGASINCPLNEVSGVLDSYKSSISDDLNKLNKSSHEYNDLVTDCCSKYKANEEKTQSLDIEKLADIISNCSEISFDYEGSAAKKLTGLPSTDLGSLIGGLILSGSYMTVKFSADQIAKIFGSQLDSKGTAGYGYDGSGCDDYARGYCLFIQTGKVPSKASVGYGGLGLTSKQVSARNRKEQAQIAYDLLKEGKPSVIHINSPSTGSGRGHWVTVVGVKKGVNRDNVRINDLLILDPVTGTVRSTTEDKEYLRTDTGRCSCEPGYHINYYV